MNQRIRLLGLCSFFLLMCWSACKEEVITGTVSDLPFNPYDSIDYGTGGSNPVIIDSSSFLGIHTFILSKKCAVPACHGGSFEPDYRTIESSYNTLVYHPVVKNNATNDFTYRVVPFDTGASWLHERITTTDPVLGRMPLYDT